MKTIQITNLTQGLIKRGFKQDEVYTVQKLTTYEGNTFPVVYSFFGNEVMLYPNEYKKIR